MILMPVDIPKYIPRELQIVRIQFVTPLPISLPCIQIAPIAKYAHTLQEVTSLHQPHFSSPSQVVHDPHPEPNASTNHNSTASRRSP